MIIILILFLILGLFYKNRLIGGLNNKMELIEYEIDMGINENNNEDNYNNENNNENNNEDNYSYDITNQSTNFGNLYGDYNISKTSNLYIK